MQNSLKCACCIRTHWQLFSMLLTEPFWGTNKWFFFFPPNRLMTKTAPVVPQLHVTFEDTFTSNTSQHLAIVHYTDILQKSERTNATLKKKRKRKKDHKWIQQPIGTFVWHSLKWACCTITTRWFSLQSWPKPGFCLQSLKKEKRFVKSDGPFNRYQITWYYVNDSHPNLESLFQTG